MGGGDRSRSEIKHMDLSNWITDPALELEGAWIDVGDGAQLRIARSGNPRFREVAKKLAAPHQVAIRNASLASDVALRILVQTLSETILLDWKGLEEGGKPLRYSKKTAERLLTELPDFRQLVAELAGDRSRFRPAPAAPPAP
jgi:hypothetical protein